MLMRRGIGRAWEGQGTRGGARERERGGEGEGKPMSMKGELTLVNILCGVDTHNTKAMLFKLHAN